MIYKLFITKLFNNCILILVSIYVVVYFRDPKTFLRHWWTLLKCLLLSKSMTLILVILRLFSSIRAPPLVADPPLLRTGSVSPPVIIPYKVQDPDYSSVTIEIKKNEPYYIQ